MTHLYAEGHSAACRGSRPFSAGGLPSAQWGSQVYFGGSDELLTGLTGQRQLLRGHQATRHGIESLARRNSVSREATRAKVPIHFLYEPYGPHASAPSL